MSAAGTIGEGMEATSPLALHLLGIFCAHEGRYEEAADAFLRAIEAEPEMVGSYVELGLVYACRREYGRMIEALRRAVEVGPGGVRAYLRERPLGDLTPANSRGAPGRAPDGLEHDGAGTHALLTSATSLLGEGRDGEAAEMLEKSLEGKPAGRPAVTTVLALTYLLRGENVEADEAGVRRVPSAAEGSGRDR
jgi:tetratricopeptide (TPR) repeat protein